MGATLTNQNFVRGEINRNLNSGNASYHSVRNISSSSFQSKNLNIRIYIDIIKRDVCGCDTWSLIQREKHRLRMFENMVLRKIFGPKRKEVTAEWRRLHNEELLTCIPYQTPIVYLVQAVTVYDHLCTVNVTTV